MPACRQLVHADHAQVVCTVLFGGVVFPVVDARNFPFRTGKGVTDPAVESSRFFLQQHFEAISPAGTVQQVRFGVFISLNFRTVPVVDLVEHVFVIGFGGKLELRFAAKIPEPAHRNLVGNFRFHIVGGRHPQVGRIGSRTVREQVQVLGVPGISRFDGTAFRQPVTGRQARLGHDVVFHNCPFTVGFGSHDFSIRVVGVKITGAEHGKIRNPNTVNKVQATGGLPLVAHECRAFQAIPFLRGTVADQIGCFACIHAAGCNGVVDDLKSVFYRVVAVRKPLKILFQVVILDARGNLKVVGAELYGDIVVVIAVNQGCIGKKPVAEQMIPAQRSRRIAPVDTERTAAKPQNVASEIAAGKKAVAAVDLIIHLGVQVVEIQHGGILDGIRRSQQEQIEVRATCSEEERTFTFLERAFEVEFARNKADATAHIEILVIPVIHFNVQHGGDTSAVLRRHTAFVQRRILYGIGIEGAEKAQ